MQRRRRPGQPGSPGDADTQSAISLASRHRAQKWSQLSWSTVQARHGTCTRPQGHTCSAQFLVGGRRRGRPGCSRAGAFRSCRRLRRLPRSLLLLRLALAACPALTEARRASLLGAARRCRRLAAEGAAGRLLRRLIRLAAGASRRLSLPSLAGLRHCGSPRRAGSARHVGPGDSQGRRVCVAAWFQLARPLQELDLCVGGLHRGTGV